MLICFQIICCRDPSVTSNNVLMTLTFFWSWYKSWKLTIIQTSLQEPLYCLQKGLHTLRKIDSYKYNFVQIIFLQQVLFYCCKSATMQIPWGNFPCCQISTIEVLHATDNKFSPWLFSVIWEIHQSAVMSHV